MNHTYCRHLLSWFCQKIPNGILNFGSLRTGERIRMACEDNITSKADQLPPEGTYKPWGIQL